MKHEDCPTKNSFQNIKVTHCFRMISNWLKLIYYSLTKLNYTGQLYMYIGSSNIMHFECSCSKYYNLRDTIFYFFTRLSLKAFIQLSTSPFIVSWINMKILPLLFELLFFDNENYFFFHSSFVKLFGLFFHVMNIKYLFCVLQQVKLKSSTFRSFFYWYFYSTAI